VEEGSMTEQEKCTIEKILEEVGLESVPVETDNSEPNMKSLIKMKLLRFL
jgi:hypothetical protein